MLVDSEDRALSFSDSASIRKETELVNRLQRNDGNIKILKRFGLHTKCYAFPNAMLEGSANLTYRGMLGNYERLSYVSKTREPERFREGLEMIQSQLEGAEDYEKATDIMRFIPDRGDDSEEHISSLTTDHTSIPPEEEASMDAVPNRRAPVEMKPEEYPRPLPEYGLGNLSHEGDEFLTQDEASTHIRHLTATEIHLRRIVVAYYEHFAHHVKAWEGSEFSERMWTDNVVQFKGKHKRTLKEWWLLNLRKKYRGREDHPNLRKEGWDLNEPSIEFLTTGATFGDMRFALVGENGNDFTPLLRDSNQTDLADEALSRFAAQLSNSSEEAYADQETEVRAFWSRLFKDAFPQFYQIRNNVAHRDTIDPEIWRRDAVKADAAMRVFWDTLILPAERMFALDSEDY